MQEEGKEKKDRWGMMRDKERRNMSKSTIGLFCWTSSFVHKQHAPRMCRGNHKGKG